MVSLENCFIFILSLRCVSFFVLFTFATSKGLSVVVWWGEGKNENFEKTLALGVFTTIFFLLTSYKSTKRTRRNNDKQ